MSDDLPPLNLHTRVQGVKKRTHDSLARDVTTNEEYSRVNSSQAQSAAYLGI